MKDMSKYGTIENDNGGFCIVKYPSQTDSKNKEFKTFCENTLFFRKESGNLRFMGNIDQCTCLSCLNDFHKKDGDLA